jgi:hypothetical protein
VTAHDEDGVEVLEWGATLNKLVLASESKSCEYKIDCSIESKMDAALEGIVEIYVRATDGKGNVTLTKDNLYVSR